MKLSHRSIATVMLAAALLVCNTESFQVVVTRNKFGLLNGQQQQQTRQLAVLSQAKKQQEQAEEGEEYEEYYEQLPPTLGEDEQGAAAGAYPSNEFSRTVSPERILKTSANSYSKDYTMNIEASSDECDALAKRFSLSDIDKLEASLSLRREPLPSSRGGGTARSYTSQSGVQVEGTVHATVTQTCVRTNEQFQVQLEFPLNCRVRPVAPVSGWNNDNDDALQQQQFKKKSAKDDRRNSSFKQMDAMELQKMLEDMDEENEDDVVIMEDQGIYTTNSMLDVGELVAQLFWLQLDPYPKKPGTKPMQASISG